MVFCGEKGPQALAGPGLKPPGDLAHRPLGPGSCHSHRFTSSRKLLAAQMGPGLKTLGCYHNPQSADLGGRWMVSEGGALQSQGGVPVFAPAFQPRPLGTWPTSP